MIKKTHLLVALLSFFLNTASGGPAPDPCPSSPNCALSNPAADAVALRPWQLARNTPQCWTDVMDVTLQIPRSTAISQGPDYIHVEIRSAMLGFIDDLELSLDRASGIIQVRSASRSGYYDFGVNQRRVAQLYQSLVNQRVILNNDQSEK